MAIEFQEAEKNLQELINLYNDNVDEPLLNEATTRLQLIDRLFFECLGWDKEDCTAEERINHKYIDYSFRCPACLFILEAKKEGIYFELPTGTKKFKYDISYFKKYEKSVYKAITQAIGYCQSHGTPYGAVCNGHQIIAFVGSRSDGRSPLTGFALVFDSLKDIQDNFRLAWQCLSKQGIKTHRLSIELSDTEILQVPQKLSARINGYPRLQPRNALQTDLQILSELFIEDIARIGQSGSEVEFLRECYCKSKALSQYAFISKEILRVRYSDLLQILTEGPSLIDATSEKGINPELLAQGLSRRPILLIGDVGVGKTMFIRHLYQVEAADVFEDSLVFYIDFGSSPAFEKDIATFVTRTLKDQLLIKYGIDVEEREFVLQVLHEDLERFEKGIYGDIKHSDPDTYQKKKIEFIEDKLKNIDNYLKLSLSHVQQAPRKKVVIFFDNVDQRPFPFQEEVFLLGQSIAENWPATIFISMRPETFYKSRLSGTLKAYHQRAFTISPPRVDEVLIKRIKYGINLLKTGIDFQFTEKFTYKAQNLSDYLEALAKTFEKKRFLNSFLENMCGGNIRLALDFVRSFVGSGHTDTEKILRIYRKQGFYNVPLHGFLHSVIYGEYQYYSPNTSEILNLFDISSPDGKEHFLAPILLSQLQFLAEKSRLEGYVDYADLYYHLQSYGFTPHQVDWSLNRLLLRNLINTPTRTIEDDDYPESAYYRITNIGIYYIQELVKQFTYIDAMVVDTPLINDNTLQNTIYADTTTDRLDRVNLFLEYLDSQWQLLEGHQFPFNWPSTRAIIKNSLKNIRTRIDEYQFRYKS